MRIAILSDTHDNIWKLDEVLKQVGDAGALLFCGDFCAPFTLLKQLFNLGQFSFNLGYIFFLIFGRFKKYGGQVTGKNRKQGNSGGH